MAFSCGGTAATLAAAGWRCVVATAFTRSVPHPAGFALDCQTGKGVPADADYMAIRRAEDAAACRRLGAEPRWLDLPEAPHRGYHSPAALFAGVLPGDDIWRSLVPALAALRDELAPAVFAPQGLGHHADHLHLIRATLAVWPAGAVTWYRDTPYALRDPAATPAAGVPAGPLWPLPVSDEAAAAKLDACAAYPTQLGFQFGGEPAMRQRLTDFLLAEGGGQPAERFAGRRLPPTTSSLHQTHTDQA